MQSRLRAHVVATLAFTFATLATSAWASVSILDSKLVSKPPGGKPPVNGLSDFGISKNGRFLVFSSRDTTFVPGANPPPLIFEIYWIDRKTGETRLVSRNESGEPANEDSNQPRVSDDGRHVTFLTLASNFGAPANVKSQVAYADVEAGTAKIVSKTWNGKIANDHCHRPEISGNGRVVAFTTQAPSLVGVLAPTSHVLVYDSVEDSLEIASFNSAGAWANNDSYYPHLDKDGRYVSFETFATNMPDANGDSFTKVVVHDRKTGHCDLTTKSQTGDPANQYVYSPTQSPNGRFVAFVSAATNLVPGGSPNGQDALYVIDRKSGKVARQVLGLDSSISESVAELSVSNNGKKVAVTSRYSSPVLPGYSIGRVRVYDLVHHSQSLVQTYDPQSVTSGNDTIWVGYLTANGKNLFFESATEVLDQEGGTSDQVYQLSLGKS